MHTSIEIFKSSLTSIYPELREQEWVYLNDNLKTINAPAKSIVIEAGKIQRHLLFLASGLVRGFYIDRKGEEITIRFAGDAGWITHYSALLAKTPSQYTFQTLESSEIIVLPYEVIERGYRQFKGLERFGRLIAEEVLKTQQKRIEQFQFLSAEERYLAFTRDYPRLFNRVSLSHLSTYLGIKRQSLTRIRKKLANSSL